ncbi:MAG TPA: ABC transporter permease, partial [Thalassospira sp.]|nr:ABC transporter permease [Thalassospira sp.]
MNKSASITAGGTFRFGLLLLAMPLLLWLFLLVILPHVDLFLVSMRERISYGKYEFSLINYIEFFAEPLYWNTYVRTAVMSIFATALTLIIGFPVSYYIAKVMRGKGKNVLFLMCLIPFWVSELV